MKVLFITLVKIDDIECYGIYSDLLRKFRNENHDVTIVCPNERKHKNNTSLIKRNGVSILNVWTTNIQKTNFFEKGITTLIIEYFFLFAIKKHLYYKDYDLIIYSTPPITFTNLIYWLKKKSRAKTYLLLKDIFPQNAVDLNIIKKDGLIYKYFRNKEKKLYKISDFIGCMSLANLNYILDKNPELNSSKIEVNPNSIEVQEYLSTNISRDTILSKYRIPNNKTLFLFGGNLGRPQGIEFLIKNISNCKKIDDAFFLIIGNGTEFKNLSNIIEVEELNNVLLIKELPYLDYEKILKCAHVGLIFLNPNFTIPNFPSRILNYMQNKMPVICATDFVSDLGSIAQQNAFGYACLTSDYDKFYDFVKKLLNNEVRENMGINAYNFLRYEYSVEESYKKIIEKC
jgi:glycosyltransferase involved in cell wall biosynthesis